MGWINEIEKKTKKSHDTATLSNHSTCLQLKFKCTCEDPHLACTVSLHGGKQDSVYKSVIICMFKAFWLEQKLQLHFVIFLFYCTVHYSALVQCHNSTVVRTRFLFPDSTPPCLQTQQYTNHSKPRQVNPPAPSKKLLSDFQQCTDLLLTICVIFYSVQYS